ncbi:MAG: hypothetical protein WC979_04290 [Candidatus Pacearchaeota archaeon]
MRERYFNKKAGVSYLEIVILILSLFAVSYIIYSETKLVETVTTTTPIDAKTTTIPIRAATIPIETITTVEANTISVPLKAATTPNPDEDLVCCEQTIDGHTCQNVGVSMCNSSLKISPNDCEDNQDFCMIGCCISPTNGLCNVRTSKRDCTLMNGTFKGSPLCNIQDCKKGCCSIGNQAIWTTEKNCKFEGNTNNKDIQTEWTFDEGSDTELKCLFAVEKNKLGACVYTSETEDTLLTERKCIYTTLGDCVDRTGSDINFDRNGTFCSNPILNTTCKAKDHQGCLEGKEDVYWFDSCGNSEDVATDCDFAAGSYCGKSGTDYICKDINCVVDGVSRRNGESWCEYDGAIGVDESAGMKDKYGKDPAGSRHIKHICYMGTERIEPCSDFRNELCVQSDSSTASGTYSTASCRVNNWRSCLSYNSKKGADAMMEKCNKNVDCFIKHVDMNGGFNFKVCLPKYPPGFVLSENTNLSESGTEIANAGDAICSIATQRCTETWICGIFGCICVDSCLCHTSYFTEKMNEFCLSLGDCGSYINYVGAYTSGGIGTRSTGDAPPTSTSNKFSKNAGPQANQKPADPGTQEFFETLNPEQLREIDGGEDENLTTNAFEQELLAVSGSMGSDYLIKILANHAENASALVGNINPRPVSMAGFFNGFASVQSSISSQIVYKERKVGGFEMIAAMIAALIAFVLTASIMITLLAAMLAFMFAMAWIMYVHIDFTCSMWEPPAGGADCNKCNREDIPCTEYRCNSLGQLCEFINKGTPNELCLSKPANAAVPVISPLLSVITTGYKYENINANGFELKTVDGNCIDAYTTVRFGIKVDPFAKCKWGIDPKQTYEEMPEYIGINGNHVLPIHRADLFFPSPEAFKNRYNLTDKQIKEIGDMTFYVKCRTADGKINPDSYSIKTCVNPGPDRTPPVITYPPQNKSFVKYNTDEQDFVFYVNEPSECKWSTSNDKDYESMENKINCNQDIHYYTMLGLNCTASLKGLINNTKYYIKCRDTSENKNAMVDNYVHEVYSSGSPLIITAFKPGVDEDIVAGVEPASFKLRLETSGGSDEGKATCEWMGNNGIGDRFESFETMNIEHSYELTRAKSGRYNINFKCEDIGGNIAENSTSFRVTLDKYGPQITRIYYDGGLRITTNKPAECRYNASVVFDFETANSMGVGDPNEDGLGLTHSGEWSSKTYYIQCQDKFKNKGTKIVVRPYELFSK